MKQLSMQESCKIQSVKVIVEKVHYNLVMWALFNSVKKRFRDSIPRNSDEVKTEVNETRTKTPCSKTKTKTSYSKIKTETSCSKTNTPWRLHSPRDHDKDQDTSLEACQALLS